MGDNGRSVPPEQRQTPPVEPSRFDRLEERVRAIEADIASAKGAWAIAKWIVPPLLIVGGGVLVFFLGRWTGG